MGGRCECERLRAEVARLRAELARHAPPNGADAALVAALREEFGGRAFLSREVWAAAAAHRAASADLCCPPHDLPLALDALGLRNPHSLGRWLGRMELSSLVGRSGGEGGRVVWCAMGV